VESSDWKREHAAKDAEKSKKALNDLQGTFVGAASSGGAVGAASGRVVGSSSARTRGSIVTASCSSGGRKKLQNYLALVQFAAALIVWRLVG